MKTIISGTLFALLLVSLFTAAFNIQSTHAKACLQQPLHVESAERAPSLSWRDTVPLQHSNVAAGQVPLKPYVAFMRPAVRDGSFVDLDIPPPVNYDEQLGLTFTQSFTSIAYNVTAVQQVDSYGYGPGYLLNGVTDKGYWYQVGLSFDWPYTAGGYAAGFYFIYEVFDNTGKSIFPASGGGLESFSGPVNNGDNVLLNLYFSSGNVVMYAYDWNTGASATVTYTTVGASYFQGQTWAWSAANGFFTGLMTEWWHPNAYYGGEAQVIYDDTTFALSSGWFWADEWVPSNGPILFSKGQYTSFSIPTQLEYFSTNNTYEAASGYLFITGARPETVYINGDGSVVPSYASISSPDNVTYTFAGNISYPTYNGIVVERSNVVIDGNWYTVQGNESGNGLSLTGTSNVTIKNTIIEGFQAGIYLYTSGTVTRGEQVLFSGQNLYIAWLGCRYSGPYSFGSNETFHVEWTASRTVSVYILNEADWESWIGIGAPVVFQSSNTAQNGYVEYSPQQSDKLYVVVMGLYGNAATLYTWTEKKIWYSYSAPSLPNSSLNIITANYIANNLYGLQLFSTVNSTIAGNSIEHNYYGIYLFSSSSNVISGNVIADSTFGVWVSSSNDNVISKNNITSSQHGILLFYSSNDTLISGNDVTNAMMDGIRLVDSFNDIITGNNLTQNRIGIDLVSSLNETLSENNIRDSSAVGIALEYSSNDIVISGNNLLNNYEGIWFDSQGSKIFHNNFIGNTIQQVDGRFPPTMNTWDNGYPSGGNYWSDYRGVDTYCGQYQNLTGSDGIGDTPYLIDANNTDHYPFMQPNGWENYPVSTESNVTITAKVIGKTALYFNVSGPSGKIGYVNATMPVGFNTTVIKVFVDLKPVQPPFPIITTNGTHYFIYFEFTLSTHEIAIQFGPAHGIAMTSVVPSKTVVGKGYSVKINVTVTNQGSYAETFKVTVFANAASIASQNVTLSIGKSATTTFIWNTTGFPRGSYTIKVQVTLAPSETNTANNTFVYSIVKVTIPGDVNGDCRVTWEDLSDLGLAYGSKPGDLNWNPNADIDSSGKVTWEDLSTLGLNYGKSW